MIQVAGMQFEIVSVNRNGAIFELNGYFHAIAFGARRKIEQGMLIETKLAEDAIEARGWGFRHKRIVRQTEEDTRLNP